jgi:hypothetical protein
VYRDDHQAAVARLEALEHDHARALHELAEARALIEGGTVRLGRASLGVIACVVLAVAGFTAGRASVVIPAPPPPVSAPKQARPTAYGTIIADGPRLGHWILTVTRCVARSDGYELTATGNSGNSVWLTANVVEVEGERGIITLEPRQCLRRDLDAGHGHGYVALDCHFEGGTVLGRVDFQDCD